MTVRAIREELKPFRHRSLRSALVHLLLMGALYVAAFAGAVALSSPLLRALLGVVEGVAAGGLFMIGHDACHGSYTHRQALNRVIGRIAFLPTYHTYSLWDLSHNRVHHIYTNLKGKDFVWLPASKREYDALSWWRRALYRLYRTPLGLMFYYPIELWSERLFFPKRELLDRPRWIYTLDCLLVVSYLALQLALTVAAGAGGSGGAWGWAAGAAFGIVVPGLVFSWLIGFVIYFNHIHPDSPWFDKKDEWSFFKGTVLGTVRLRFPRAAMFFTSNIMDHVAHHMEPRIPLVRLPEASDRLEQLLEGQGIVQAWSFAAFRDILARCKLYDYEAHRWTDYDGTPTTERNYPLRRPAAEREAARGLSTS